MYIYIFKDIYFFTNNEESLLNNGSFPLLFNQNSTLIFHLEKKYSFGY